MQEQSLFYESVYDALKATCMACGGLKAVASKLWPEKKLDTAHRLLSDSLNEDRNEKLSLDQILFILKLGRENDCHLAMNFIASESGYEAKPVDRETEQAKLQREFIAAQKSMQVLVNRMEKAGML